MLIDLDNKLCRDIQDWCEQVNMPINEYIESVLRMDLSLRKYGDLNEKVGKRRKSDTIKEVISEFAEKEEPTVEVQPEVKPIVPKEEPVQVKEVEIIEPKEEEPQPKQVKKKQRIINIH